MKRKLLQLMVGVAFFSGTVAWAHHSFAATYNLDRTVKIEGRLVQFLFRNPHSFVHVMAPDGSGKMQRWSVEWGGASQLTGQGMSSATVRPGDVVVITGAPGRNTADHRILLRTLVRPSDGFEWGTRPTEVVD